MHRISYGCNEFILKLPTNTVSGIFVRTQMWALQSNAQSSHTKYFKTLANIFMPMTNFHNKQVSRDDMLLQEKVLFVSYNYSDIYLYRNNFIENSLRVLFTSKLQVRNSYNLLLLSRLQGLSCKYHVYFYISLHFRRDICSCDSDTNIC